MVAAANLVEVAALVGDTARATMLAALMGGQSLTATELAYCANVSRSTASGHLSKLVAARLLTVTRKGRFSYYRIASPLVATMLESIKVVAAIEMPPAISRGRHTTTQSASPEVATITWPVAQASLLPTRLWPWGTSRSPMKAARSRLRARASLPRSAPILGRGLGGYSASLASTGPSAVITSRDSSALRFCIVFWSWGGSNVCRAAVHSD
jgi:DNA-binding transcriptional ArsR family regulator